MKVADLSVPCSHAKPAAPCIISCNNCCSCTRLTHLVRDGLFLTKSEPAATGPLPPMTLEARTHVVPVVWRSLHSELVAGRSESLGKSLGLGPMSISRQKPSVFQELGVLASVVNRLASMFCPAGHPFCSCCGFHVSGSPTGVCHALARSSPSSREKVVVMARGRARSMVETSLSAACSSHSAWDLLGLNSLSKFLT